MFCFGVGFVHLSKRVDSSAGGSGILCQFIHRFRCLFIIVPLDQISHEFGKNHERLFAKDLAFPRIATVHQHAVGGINQLQILGARRLYTVMERVFEELSFTAPDKAGAKVTVDAAFVEKNLGDLSRSTDLSRYVL